MRYQILTKDELNDIKPGEAITLTAVMAVLTVAVMMVVIYRLFNSSKGGATIPGGWKFSWA